MRCMKGKQRRDKIIMESESAIESVVVRSGNRL